MPNGVHMHCLKNDFAYVHDANWHPKMFKFKPLKNFQHYVLFLTYNDFFIKKLKKNLTKK